jgi:molybdenum cofactor cytidylyltransferase
MGGANKLVLDVEGTALVRRVAESALSASLDPVVVVVGHGAAEVRRALSGLPLTFAENDHPEEGLSSSLRRGLDALSAVDPTPSGALVLLGDMPWVRPADIAALLDAFDPALGSEICVPVHEGRRGNPVLWGARFFTEMKELRGDVGARELMERHAGSVREVAVDGSGVLTDADTPEAFRAAIAGMASGSVEHARGPTMTRKALVILGALALGMLVDDAWARLVRGLRLERVDYKKVVVGSIRIHHNVLGYALVLVGLFVHPVILIPMGLGMIVGHRRRDRLWWFIERVE